MTTSALTPSGSTRRWRKIRAGVLARDERICRYCGNKATDVHHVLPRAMGGVDSEDNLVAACHECNATIGVSLVKPPRTDTPALSSPSPGVPPYQRPPTL